MSRLRWAILGPGAISGDFANALGSSQTGVLHAVGSTDRLRAARFATTHGARHVGSYAEVLQRDDIDAVYIGTVHPTHAELSTRALTAGKAVLCEKPAALDARSLATVLDAARDADRPFIEAYKYRFGPFADRLRQLVSHGEIGRPARVEATFGFEASPRGGRLFDVTLAGGAIFDVGGYPASFAVGIAAAAGLSVQEPALHSASGDIAGGVDESARAEFGLSGMTAVASASIVSQLPRGVRILGTGGQIKLADAWGSRVASAASITVTARGHRHTESVPTVQPMAAEADALALAVHDERLEAPEMPWRDSLAVAAMLEMWRHSVNPAHA